MVPVLPPQVGLTVGGVFYRYTIEKDPTTDSYVHIQNENAIDGGLLYRNTDNWSGLPGNTITNSFLLPDIPKEYLGAGSIEVEGDGTVKNATVFYNYKYDTCVVPLSDPSCPGYIEALYKFLLDNGLLNSEISLQDALDDPFVLAALDQEVERREEDELEEEQQEEEEEENLEEALAAADNALTIADGAAQAAMLTALTSVPQFDSYLQTTIPGGVYNETISFEPKELPDNINGLRVGFAQQVLHEQMVDSQYQLGND
jgi:hypothetical protein